MAKIKILALTKATGGIAFYNRMLLAALDPGRFESHTICLSDNAEAYAAALQAEGLSAEPFAMARYRIRPGGDLRVLRHVLKTARSRQADLLLCHGSKAGFIGRAAGRFLGLPAIYRQASMPFLRRVQGGKAPLYWGLEHLAGRFGGRLVAITEHARRETLARRVVKPGAIRVIRTGIDTARFRPRGIRAAVAAEFGLDPARPVVGWLGRLEPQKAPLDYLAALRIAAPLHPAAQFVIAGEGSLQGAVEQQLASGGLPGNVRLLPWQNDPAHAFQAMDIFAMSSLWEGLPLTLLEAMACGCAPVSTAVDGCSEAVAHGESGLLVPPGDPAAMAAALDSLLADPAHRRACAQAARQRVQALFDRKRMVREWETLLEDEVQASGGAAAIPPPVRTASGPAAGLAPAAPAAAPPPQGSLRICMVISSYHPVVGGAEKQVAQLAGLMRARGHHLRVITRRYPGLPALETIGGIEVQRVRCSGPKPVAAARFLAGAARAIRSYAPDVIHCHSAFSPALAGLAASALTGRPLLVKPMCGGETASVFRKAGGGLRRAAMARRVSRFIAVSREISDELQGFGIPPQQILHIPNGVDTERFRPCSGPAEKAALRRSLGLPDGILFLFAGRIARQKQLPLLLEAWPAAAAGCPQATLLIAGANRQTAPGHDANAGDADAVPPHLLAQEGVRLLGHVEDMPAYLRAADIFVLPSAREGLSNALLEACASGLAVVASRVGGTEDVIRDGENGRLFPPDDPDALARILAGLAQDPEQRRALGAAAARTAARQLDIRLTADRLLAAYAGLCGPGAAQAAPPGSALFYPGRGQGR